MKNLVLDLITGFVLATSLVVNALLFVELRQTKGDYERLLAWACDHGNGGAECGEE